MRRCFNPKSLAQHLKPVELEMPILHAETEISSFDAQKASVAGL